MPEKETAKEQGRTGLIVSDDAGNYYYLRPEVLDKTRMPKEDVERFKHGLSEVSKGAFPPVTGSLRIPSSSKLKDPQDLAAGTVMCPW